MQSIHAHPSSSMLKLQCNFQRTSVQECVSVSNYLVDNLTMRAIILILCTLFLSYITAEEDEMVESTTELQRLENYRTARQLNIPPQEYIVRGHPPRQVLKISGNTRVKVIQPPAQQLRPVRSSRIASNQRPRPQQKRQRPFEEDYTDEEYKTPKKSLRKNRKGYAVQEVSPQEFYEDEDFDVFQKKPKQKPYAHTNQNKKRYRKPVNNKLEYSFDSSPQASTPEKRPYHDEESSSEFEKYKQRDQHMTSFGEGVYGNDDSFAASSITMKQVEAPNLALDSPSLRKELHNAKKQTYNDQDGYAKYPTESTAIRKSPSTRQMQSVFPQHYTTHNPYVTRNLGIEDQDRTGFFHNDFDQEQTIPDLERHQQHFEQERIAAASEQRPTLLPTGSSGIHIVKPPQLRNRDNIASTGTTSTNQRTTIRDILLQDCPDAEELGYCASPPRYPTQQINNIMSKCGELIDSMYSPAPIDPEDDLSSFSSRSDLEQDIQFVDTDVYNSSNTLEQWSRSSNDGSNTMCESVLTQTEPGYAREVTSGRWFVIMQTMDAIVQRVMTDTCDRPGKPCGGLAGLKCSRSNFQHSYKATRCVQRYSQQRLISWDPEAPQACPKIRVFRFPTACLCHLSVD